MADKPKYLTSASDEFETPPELFRRLDKEFHFTVDAAASDANHLLPAYWTREQNALLQSWSGHRVFCNPPYSRGNVEAFFYKAYAETRTADAGCTLAVLLIPTYTERKWFHDYRHHFEVRFICGRVKFGGGEFAARGNHMLVIFRHHSLAWWSC